MCWHSCDVSNRSEVRFLARITACQHICLLLQLYWEHRYMWKNWVSLWKCSSFSSWNLSDFSSWCWLVGEGTVHPLWPKVAHVGSWWGRRIFYTSTLSPVAEGPKAITAIFPKVGSVFGHFLALPGFLKAIHCLHRQEHYRLFPPKEETSTFKSVILCCSCAYWKAASGIFRGKGVEEGEL